MSANQSKPKRIPGAGIDQENYLELKPDTVSLLTKRIEANLKNTQNRKLPQKRKNAVTGENDKAGKKAERKMSKPKYQQEGAPSGNNAIGAADLELKPQGKKRLRDGQVKSSSNVTSRPNGISKVRRAQSHDDSVDHSRLEQEILALGGSKDDLKLIEDGASESELEGGTPSSGEPAAKDLEKDLLRFVQELGIEEVSQETDEASELDQDDKEPYIQSNGVNDTKPSGKSESQYQVEPNSEWHTIALPPVTSSKAKAVALPPDMISRIQGYAKSLLDAENERYASQTGSASSAQQFYSTIMSSGTLSDKISALTLSVQESPLHNMRALEALVGLARKRSRGQAVEVLGALKDLFGLGSVLPPDRKLRAFVAQPDVLAAFMSRMNWRPDDPLPKGLTKAHLIYWAFEDWLKGIYFEILKILETWCNDEVVFARGKAVDYVCQLLKEKPEQEANLLRLLVNKLGDSDKKVASKTSYHILRLETAHPLMKPTIISSIETDLIFRPGQSLHAQYYAVITLNQTILSAKEEDVAKKLLDIYFSLFAKLLAKSQPVKPLQPEPNPIKLNQYGEVQGGGGPAGKAARRKAALKEKAATVEDDLREKMLSAVLTGVNRAVPYTNTNDEVFEKHMDTLFRITHSSNFNTSIQALMLIQQLSSTHQGSVDRFYRTLYESLLDPRLLTSSKHALYLNLLFKSLRADLNVKRVRAFVKRLLQVVSMHQPAFACGTMYMTRELESVFANLSSFVDEQEEDYSDEVEVFHDLPDVTIEREPPPIPSNGLKAHKPKREVYDGRKRDPEHSNADKSCLWEILPFLTHYHPSVSLFATRLLTHSPMPPKPDLASHTLIHFLDRFVYRNPKTTASAHGTSIMQPLSSASAFDTSKGANLLSSAPSFKTRIKQPVNSEAFWKQEAENVAADEVFFHKYFSTVGKGREKARGRKERRKKGRGVDEDEDGDGSEDEEEIWKALVESRPEIEEGSGDDEEFGDEDIDMDELDGEVGSGAGSEPDGVVLEEEDDGKVVTKHDRGSDNDDNDEAMPDFGEDEDALLDSDDDVPSDLEAAFEKEVKATNADAQGNGKGKNKGRRERRMKFKQLPTFASADEYAEILEEEEEEKG